MINKEFRKKVLTRQVDRLQRRLVFLQQISNRYAFLRLAIFTIGFIINLAVFLSVGPAWMLLSFGVVVVAFLVVVYAHNQIDIKIGRHEIWLGISKTQIARMNLDWENIPQSEFIADTPLALDLDLLGPHSIQRLLNTAVTEGGSQRLKTWLTTSVPDPEKVLQRQALVKELVNRSLFRKRLILNGRYASGDTSSKSPDKILTWLQEQRVNPTLKYWVWALGVLAFLNLILFGMNQIELLPPLWPFTLGLYALLMLYKSQTIDEPFKAASHLRDVLEQISAVFKQLESHAYQRTPILNNLCKPFHQPSQKPSDYLRRLNLLVNATGLRGNPLLAILLNVLFPYDLFFAYQLQLSRASLTRRLPSWLDIWYELEALSSIANLAFLNPHYTFPDWTLPDQILFRAESIGHPLIPENQKKLNNFEITKPGFIGIITGSNMSGKSTFLRTIGVNLVLANCGGPVDAEKLMTNMFQLHTCIRISDSITTGISHFYAEVRCLKALFFNLKSEGPLPLFYLIDEIFQGTNNRERLTGSRSFIRELAKRSGIGLVSTHDLELAQLAEEFSGVFNYHFKDEVRDGRLTFDYSIQPGASPTTNALKIMRLEGLPVEEV